MDNLFEFNRRKHIRFELNVPLIADLSLFQVKDREISSRSQRVLLQNISVGGCGFRTGLQLPIRNDVIWQLQLELGSYATNLKAAIVHSHLAEDYFVYGMRWMMTNAEQQTLQYRLNDFVRLVLISSPHILTLYKKIEARAMDGQFKNWEL